MEALYFTLKLRSNGRASIVASGYKLNLRRDLKSLGVQTDLQVSSQVHTSLTWQALRQPIPYMYFIG